MSLALQLSNIRKQYGSRAVLDGFDLDIEPGSSWAITGQSGSGKSTLLNILGLLDSPDSGSVELLGKPAPKPRTKAALVHLRQDLGYLFQNFALIDSDTVAQNLDIALTYRKDTTPKKQLMADALHMVGLAGTETRPVFSLSGGEQQRVAVARLMLKPCSIILADEPTGSLDEENRDIVLELLRQLNHQGKTIIISTHDPVVASVCAHRVTLSTTASSAAAPSPGTTQPTSIN